MKRLLTVLAVFGFGVVVGSLLEEQGPLAEAGQEPACAPLLVTGGGVVIQDMNGDRVFDPIAEAVRLLSWAFLGAPAPVPPCCTGGGPSGLPDTGQTTCYDSSGRIIDCTSATCPGQDGSYATGCPIDGADGSGRFTDNGDGTVTDTCTGLMWQKDTADVDGDGQSTAQDFSTWCDALAHCESLSFAGHDDWRLPNVPELQSIVDHGRFNPSMDPVFGAIPSFYWSSTSFAANPVDVWSVAFSNGFVSFDDKVSIRYVRAVRPGP